MQIEIKVPAMGESISSATVGTLLQPSGAQVEADEEILELETDKVNHLLYAPQAGILTWKVNTGDKVTIGQSLGFIEPSAAKKEEALKEKKEVAVEKPSEKTGARISKEDFIAELQTKPEKPQPLIPKIKENRETRRKMSTLRRVIAERLVQVQQNTASLTTFNEVDMTEILLLREKYRDLFAEKHGVKLGFMSFFVKAVAEALEVFPDFNSYIEGDEIVHREYCDIGVAVGTEKGLFVPVIRNADQLSYSQIELAIAEYAKKAKDGRISLDDLQGGGFTITNGGVYGSLLSTPILNPPQSAILGMHKIEKRAVVRHDQIEIRSMMYLALTYDHRLLDGKDAVSFLVYIKNMLEDPARQVLHV